MSVVRKKGGGSVIISKECGGTLDGVIPLALRGRYVS